MENKKKENPIADINPVSRPSNEEIEDDIADDVNRSSTTQQPIKFSKTNDSGEGVED